ncbi:MAG: MBL fold metallo-hydrolase, partial [Christensenellales bacterium]
YTFQVMDLSGHSPGQAGLYDEEAGVMFCGDHVLDRITPNISAYDLETDYLALYLKNLKAIRSLPIKHLFTAHRELPEDPQKRIDTLIRHHENRLMEVLLIVKNGGEMTPFEVAKQMSWSLKKSFDEFPKMQKWFACSEAMAHLQYLYNDGSLQRNQNGKPLVYAV